MGGGARGGAGGDAGAEGAAYRSFGEFYPFYLAQHADRTCRRLHFAGTSAGLAAALTALATLNACFTYPFYSLLGDWAMWKDMLTGRIRF